MALAGLLDYCLTDLKIECDCQFPLKLRRPWQAVMQYVLLIKVHGRNKVPLLTMTVEPVTSTLASFSSTSSSKSPPLLEHCLAFNLVLPKTPAQ